LPNTHFRKDVGVQIHEHKIEANGKQGLGIEIKIKIGVRFVARRMNNTVAANVRGYACTQIKDESEMLGVGFLSKKANERENFNEENG